MFIRLADVRRLLKTAYKGVGLRIGRDTEGIFLTGRKWYMYIFSDNLPKEVLGEIISLIGVLPVNGEQWLCDKHGQQTEIYKVSGREDVYQCAMKAQADGHPVMASNMILLDEYEKEYRIYSASGELYLVPAEYTVMCNTGNCDSDEEMQGCFVDKEGWIYWVSSYMAFGISPYEIEDLDSWLEEIREAEIV